MPAQGPKTGHRMKLYYNSATPASPTWVEVCEVGDVSISDLTRGMAELKRRCKDYTKNLATLIQSISIEFRLHHGLNATVFDRIVADFFAATPRQWAVMNGDITDEDNEGFVMPALIESFPWDQPLEDVSGHDVRLVIAYMLDGSSNEVDPEWLVVE